MQIYRPLSPQATDYYQCVEDHLHESLIQGYEERFELIYGFFRPNLRNVLDCGNLRNGFARVKYGDCNHEYLLAFSCKRYHFYPSCHQKLVVEFGGVFIACFH
ncbi:MAG: transposase zinc-binding domain-containing protein [Syntrophaceae bacterium]|nr:transposase zinc-binding domain-containing protein [Syntrophaceae bacterium]